MPDIKTALATALKEWEPPTEGTVIKTPAPTPVPAPAPAAKTSRNMTRDCFTVIRDNPGITRTNAIQRLEAMGHKPNSATSIISQMVKTKMVSEVGHGILSTKRKNYTPLQTKVRKVDKTQAKVKPEVVAASKPSEAAPKPQATPAPAPSPQRVSMNVDEWLDTVPLKTARQVYWKLHGIFGGQEL